MTLQRFHSQRLVLDNGAKLVYMNYNGGRLSVQTPWMTMPWKMGVYTEGEYPKYNIDLFKGMDEDPELQAFHDKFQELKNKIIDGGVENSVAWFKKKTASRDVIDALFGRMIKVSTKNKILVNLIIKWPDEAQGSSP